MTRVLCLFGAHRWEPRWLSFDLYLGEGCQRCGTLRPAPRLEKTDQER